jgi:hypothetical protein
MNVAEPLTPSDVHRRRDQGGPPMREAEAAAHQKQHQNEGQ